MLTNDEREGIITLTLSDLNFNVVLYHLLYDPFIYIYYFNVDLDNERDCPTQIQISIAFMM